MNAKSLNAGVIKKSFEKPSKLYLLSTSICVIREISTVQ